MPIITALYILGIIISPDVSFNFWHFLGAILMDLIFNSHFENNEYEE
jgi:hypothetical protein